MLKKLPGLVRQTYAAGVPPRAQLIICTQFVTSNEIVAAGYLPQTSPTARDLMYRSPE